VGHTSPLSSPMKLGMVVCLTVALCGLGAMALASPQPSSVVAHPAGMAGKLKGLARKASLQRKRVAQSAIKQGMPQAVSHVPELEVIIVESPLMPAGNSGGADIMNDLLNNFAAATELGTGNAAMTGLARNGSAGGASDPMDEQSTKDNAANLKHVVQSCSEVKTVLEQVFALRQRLGRLTKNLDSLGYVSGREWQGQTSFMGPVDMRAAVCPLLNGPHDSQSSFADEFLGRMLDDKTSDEGATSCGTSGEEAVRAMARLTTIAGTFAALGSERGLVDSMNALLSENLASVEADFGNMLLQRDCPGASTAHTAGSRHVCFDLQERWDASLQMKQKNMPGLRQKITDMKARIANIDAGSTQECQFGSSSPAAAIVHSPMNRLLGKPLPGQTANRADVHMAWCAKVEPLVESLAEGQKGQNEWRNEMIGDMQNVTTIALDVKRRMNGLLDHHLDSEFPWQSMKELTKVWDEVEQPLRQMHAIGENREREAASVGEAVVELHGILKGLSDKHGCTVVQSGQSKAKECSSLRAALAQELRFHSQDVENLQANMDKELSESVAGLKDNGCNHASDAPGSK